MKNTKVLYGKSNNIIICSKCKFFPTFRQLRRCRLEQDLFQYKWICQFCQSQNICTTDNQFRYFCNNSQLLIDETQYPSQEILLLIDVSEPMKENYCHLVNINLTIQGHQGKKYTQICKKQQLIEESQLLLMYMQSRAIEQRIKKGRFFSWDNFIKQKNFSKIEYALWLVDFLKIKIKNIKYKFFYLQKTQLNQTSAILNKSFFKKIGIQQKQFQNNIIKLKDLQVSQKKLVQIIVISSSNINQVTKQLKSIKKTLQPQQITIINMQQLIDPITLGPTATGQRIKSLNTTNNTNANVIRKQQYKIQQHINVRILDSKELDNYNFKQFANFLREYFILQNNNINMFHYRSDKISNKNITLSSKNDIFDLQINKYDSSKKKQRAWVKVIDKQLHKQIILKRFRQRNIHINSKNSSTLEKSRQSVDLISDFSDLIDKTLNSSVFSSSNVHLQSLIQYFMQKINSNSGKNNLIRVSIQLKSLINNSRYTILWQNAKYSSSLTAYSTGHSHENFLITNISKAKSLYPQLEKSKQNSSNSGNSSGEDGNNYNSYYDNGDDEQYETYNNSLGTQSYFCNQCTRQQRLDNLSEKEDNSRSQNIIESQKNQFLWYFWNP